jgi:hypothetical protein
MPRRIEVHIRNRFRKENLSKARITFLNRILTTMKQLRNEHGLSDKEILENLREQAK